jgi:probable UDP-sugar transporter A4
MKIFKKKLRKRIQYLAWLALLSFQVLSYGSYAILVHFCEENGKISFNSASMNFLIEFIKLLFSVFCFSIKSSRIIQFLRYKKQKQIFVFDKEEYSLENNSNTENKFRFKNSIQFCIPAFLYFLNNNLAVYIQLYMDSTSYQMLSNLKILTTAILYHFIIGKSFSKSKSSALGILFVSGVLYSIANLRSISNYYLNIELDQAEKDSVSDVGKLHFRLRDEIYITQQGLIMVIVYCIISGLAGVYNEYLLKLNFDDSINLQNIYLYIYGSLFNLIAIFVQIVVFDDTTLFAEKSLSYFFTGFSIYTWTIVFTQVFNGISMSIVMKHSSNITRLFVISSSLVVTTVLSIAVFSLKLNFYFYFAFFLTFTSLYIYLK